MLMMKLDSNDGMRRRQLITKIGVKEITKKKIKEHEIGSKGLKESVIEMILITNRQTMNATIEGIS